MVINNQIYFTNLDNTDANEITNTLFPYAGYHGDTFATTYMETSPFSVMVSSFSDLTPSSACVNTYVSPTGSIYSSTPLEDILPILSKQKPHKHDFFELMFVLDGEIYVSIENHRHLYPKGSGCILNRQVMHYEEWQGQHRILFLQISYDFLKQIYSDLCLSFFDVEKKQLSGDIMLFLQSNLFKENTNEKAHVDFIPPSADFQIFDAVHDYFDIIFRETLSPDSNSSRKIKNAIVELFDFISSSENFSTTPVKIGSDVENYLYSEIVRVIEESCGRISRSQLSEKLNYSGAYLNDICKKHSGLSLYNFGMTYCIKEAARLLSESSYTVSEVEAYLGFTNSTQFYKEFKKAYGVTPAKYKRRTG